MSQSSSVRSLMALDSADLITFVESATVNLRNFDHISGHFFLVSLLGGNVG